MQLTVANNREVPSNASYYSFRSLIFFPCQAIQKMAGLIELV